MWNRLKGKRLSLLQSELFRENISILKCIICLFFLSRLSFVLVGLFINVQYGTDATIIDFLNQFDAGWYTGIIENGYMLEPSAHSNGDAANWAFSPLYPLIVFLVKLLLPINSNVAGVLVSNICILAASFWGAKLYILSTGNEDVTPFVFLTLAGPYAFYFSSTYAEALFFLLITLFLYNLKQKHFVLAGLFCGLATAARTYGVFLVFVLILALYYDSFSKLRPRQLLLFIQQILKTPYKMLSILLCPLGCFSYMAYLYMLLGDPIACIRVLRAWKAQPVNIVTELFAPSNYQYFYLALVLMVSFFIFIFLVVKRKRDEVCVGAACLIQHSSALFNIGRHGIGMVFIGIGGAMLIESFKKYETLIYIFLSLWEVILIYCWFCRSPFMI